MDIWSGIQHRPRLAWGTSGIPRSVEVGEVLRESRPAWIRLRQFASLSVLYGQQPPDPAGMPFSNREQAALESIGEIIGRSSWAPVGHSVDNYLKSRYSDTLEKLKSDDSQFSWLTLLAAWARLTVSEECDSPIRQFDDEKAGANLERPLWEKVQKFGNGSLRRWVHPQVAVGSLLGNPIKDIEQERRVDFVFCPPWDEPHVWEIHGQFDRRDRDKDNTIRKADYTTINQIAGQTTDQQVEQFLKNLVGNPKRCPWTLNDIKLVDACWISAQIEFGMHQALVERRWSSQQPVVSIDVTEDHRDLAETSALDFLEIAKSVLRIWDPNAEGSMLPSTMEVKINEESGWVIHIDPNGPSYLSEEKKISGYVIRRFCVPWQVPLPRYPWQAKTLSGIAPKGHLEKDDLVILLKRVFGFEQFRDGQAQAIKRILKRKDTLLVLPTGGGKSLVFQFAALLLPGATLVVEGWRALIDDQARSLQNIGFGRISAIHRDRQMEEHAIDDLLLYMAPERLYIESFEPTIEKIIQARGIDLLVVDEAHAVSEAGHSFRPSYLGLVDRVERLCKRFNGQPPPTLALTATASPPVMKDIQAILKISTTPMIPGAEDVEISMARKNIKDCILFQQKNPMETLLKSVIENPLAVGRGIVFCASKGNWYESNRRNYASWYGVNGVCEKFQEMEIEGEISHYIGGDSMSADEREQNTQKYLSGECRVMVATNAFGTGIDIPAVRWTCHVGMPAGMEAYYQEFGRSGRDGKDSTSFLIIDGTDDLFDELTRFAKEPNAFERLRQSLRKYARNGGGLSRQLQLMVGSGEITAEQIHPMAEKPEFVPSFPGWKIESEVIDKYVLDSLSQGNRGEPIEIPFKSHTDPLIWKSVHRLKELGVISPGYSRTFHQGGLNNFQVTRENLSEAKLEERLIKNSASILESLMGKNDGKREGDELARRCQAMSSPWEKIAEASETVLRHTYQMVQEIRLQSINGLRRYTRTKPQEKRWKFIDEYFVRDSMYSDIKDLASNTPDFDSWEKALELILKEDSIRVGMLIKVCDELPMASLPRFLLCFSPGTAESDSEMILYLRTWMLDDKVGSELRAWALRRLFDNLKENIRQRLLRLIQDIWNSTGKHGRQYIAEAVFGGLPESAGSNPVVSNLVGNWFSMASGGTHG